MLILVYFHITSVPHNGSWSTDIYGLHCICSVVNYAFNITATSVGNVDALRLMLQLQAIAYLPKQIYVYIVSGDTQIIISKTPMGNHIWIYKWILMPLICYIAMISKHVGNHLLKCRDCNWLLGTSAQRLNSDDRNHPVTHERVIY